MDSIINISNQHQMESDGNTTIQFLDSSASSTIVDPTPHIYYGTPQLICDHDSVSTLLSSTGAGTLSMMFSMDNSVWDVSYNYVYVPGAPLHNTLSTQARWYRSVFVNDDTSASIRLQTILHKSGVNVAPANSSNSVTVSGQPIQVYVVNQTDISSTDLKPAPATGKWSSSRVTGTTIFIPNSFGRTIHTIYAVNFQPDYRFLKFYDMQSTAPIDVTVTEPTITYALVPDVQLIQTFPTGLKFDGHIGVRATRLLDPEDTNGAQRMDIQVFVTYL